MKQEFEETMKVGVKYAGYGVINAFREFQFYPSQKGAREGRLKMVKQGEGWSVSTTRENIIVHIRLPRKDKALDRISEFLRLQNFVMQVLKDYDLSIKPKTKKEKK